MQIINDKKTIRAWSMFDWANSAYNLVITSTIFPAYYVAITRNADNGDRVSFFGMEFIATALSNYALSIAYLIMALSLPILSSIADYRGNKKIFMMIFTWVGSIACSGLYFFDINNIEIGIILFSVAAMGYVGGVMFNNSYLPEIASPDVQDKVSATGFAYGYVGSVVLQIICFVFVLAPKTFGFTEGGAAQFSFFLTGLWWIIFAQIPFRKLPKGSPNYSKLNTKVIRGGFSELKNVWKKITGMRLLKRFLISFFFYSMGVQTVMLVAAAFGEKVLNLGAPKLIATILIIQLVAIFGAYLMSRMALKFGNIKVLMAVVLIWIFVCISAFFVSNEYQFYVVAAVVGLVMGGIQSLSRSTYSKFLPESSPQTASFFSFYDVTEKVAIVIGLASFAYIEEFTGNMRNSALFLTVFFSIGLVLLGSMFFIKNDTLINKEFI